MPSVWHLCEYNNNKRQYFVKENNITAQENNVGETAAQVIRYPRIRNCVHAIVTLKWGQGHRGRYLQVGHNKKKNCLKIIIKTLTFITLTVFENCYFSETSDAPVTLKWGQGHRDRYLQVGHNKKKTALKSS